MERNLPSTDADDPARVRSVHSYKRSISRSVYAFYPHVVDEASI